MALFIQNNDIRENIDKIQKNEELKKNNKSVLIIKKKIIKPIELLENIMGNQKDYYSGKQLNKIYTHRLARELVMYDIINKPIKYPGLWLLFTHKFGTLNKLPIDLILYIAELIKK